MIGILSEFSGEKHFADSLNCGLSEYTILDHHIVFYNDLLKLQSGLLINSVYDKGIYRRFESYYLLSQVAGFRFFLENGLKDARVVLKQLFIQKAEETDTFNGEKHVVLIFGLNGRAY